ncbi:MAG: hypothetical protein AAGA88_06190 [Pseudomonadota bacterium]
MQNTVRILSAFVVATGVTAAAPSVAQVANDSDRYILERTESGFIRMDRQTGDMSVCTEQAGSLACRGAADDRTILSTEVEQLRRENAELRRQIAAISKALGVEAPAIDVPPENSLVDGLPTEEDLDQAMDIMEGVMRRFFGMVDRLREDLEAPKDPNET